MQEVPVKKNEGVSQPKTPICSTIKQLAKEFAIPLSLAALWSTFVASRAADWDAKIANFGVAFTGSWVFFAMLTGSWFRVRKQQRVDGTLQAIASRAEEVLVQLEERTNAIVSHVTGGESVCYLFPLAIDPTRPLLLHEGEYPVYDIKARITDLQRLAALNRDNAVTSHDIFFGDHTFEVDLMTPKIGRPAPVELNIGDRTAIDYLIFYNARNGIFHQALHLRKVHEAWVSAIRVTKDDKEIYTHVSKGFPGSVDGSVNWSELRNVRPN